MASCICLTCYKVRVPCCADAVRDHDARAAVAQAPDSLRNKLLAANVQCRRGLVKEQQRRIAQKCARYNQALPLPNAQVAEGGTHLCLEAVLQLGHNVRSPAVSDRLLYLLLLN